MPTTKHSKLVLVQKFPNKAKISESVRLISIINDTKAHKEGKAKVKIKFFHYWRFTFNKSLPKHEVEWRKIEHNKAAKSQFPLSHMVLIKRSTSYGFNKTQCLPININISTFIDFADFEYSKIVFITIKKNIPNTK